MPKQIYTWSSVTAGDIISFRYKGTSPTEKLTTLLVMNPKLPFIKKDGTKKFHLVGLKLEESGNIPTIRSRPFLVQLLESLGNIEVVSGDDQIYRITIKNFDKLGVRPQVYKELKKYIKDYSVYRTYDFIEATKSQVFLEPISLPKGLREALLED
tara:strand:- start:151 stop:615 length:465 start_codon:yes stop_codon:yes gene_type:complete